MAAQPTTTQAQTQSAASASKDNVRRVILRSFSGGRCTVM